VALTAAHAPGATPLSKEDLEGLRIASVRTHGELNEVEAANIIGGQEWALRTRSARLHYRIVTVHPFPNGNGRHARMVADVVLMQYFKHDPLSWGNSALYAADAATQAYITALVAADNNDFAPLLAFATSKG
jgi:fido (protein-threonine AMPylation protein)